LKNLDGTQDYPDDVKLVLHLLQTDPDAFERLIEPQMRRQYQQALEALQ
jgi:hypothetical protein